MLDQVVEEFARFAANMERDYVFAWMDWDGDNVLAQAGIIDYGSVRQFGLRHDQYRYDDVERYSTNLNEQRQKARMMLQAFAQMVDFLETKEKKTLVNFKNSLALKKFDELFQTSLLERFVWQLGFPKNYQRILMNKHQALVKKLYKAHVDLERKKTYRKLHAVADGLNRPAILNMRSAIAEYPKKLLSEETLSERELFRLLLAQSASQKDRKLSDGLKGKLRRWQSLYRKVLEAVSSHQSLKPLLEVMAPRAASINREDRVTGNALIGIVDEIMTFDKKNSDAGKIQAIIEEFIDHQTLNPDFDIEPLKSSITPPKKLMETLIMVLQEHNEDI